MSTSVQRLQSTGIAMRQALSTQDWAAIGDLDLQCRQAVEDAMVDAIDDEGALRAKMEELLELYKDLVTACHAERQRLANELVQLNQSQHGAKVYQLFG